MKCLRCKKPLNAHRVDFGYCQSCTDVFRDSGKWPAFDGNPAHLHQIVLKASEGDEVCVCGFEGDNHES